MQYIHKRRPTWNTWCRCFLQTDSFSTVREELEKQGVVLASAEISMVPQNIVDLDINKAPTFTKLIDMLEDDDDVQNVWHNAEFPEGYEG